ncbi:MAG: hypothetical protein ABIB71_03295 [Candidatus Woesearchaeota archaeon]
MEAIHLNKHVDDIFSGYSKLETPEERKEHKVEGSLMFEGFEELVRQYEEILATKEWDNLQKLLAKNRIILEPEEINRFLQATIGYESHKLYCDRTGFFITRLIQNSNDAGNNKFILSTKALAKELRAIGYNLRGKHDRPLEIRVDGNTGGWCGFEAQNIRQIYIGGNAGGDCGYKAKDIGKIHIAGNSGGWCGSWAENIKEIYIGGEAGAYCGHEAENLAFKTPNKQTLRLLKEHVPKGKGNRIYFIHPDNHEEEIKW